MNFEKFKTKFHYSWWGSIKKFIESEECNKIYKFLKERSEQGAILCPLSMNTYRTFQITSLNDLKCVIIGDAPYNIIDNDTPTASGIYLGSNTAIQNDLRWFYTGIEKELFNGLNLNYIQDSNIEYLSNQGVLMLNSSLTSEKDMEHYDIWKPFIKYVLEEIIKTTGVPIIVIGEEAKKSISDLRFSKTNNIYFLPKITHNWNTQNIFSKVSQDIWESNKDTIMWLPFDIEDKNNLPF